MRIWFRIPFISLPAKFCARILMAAIWGLVLSDGDVELRIAFGAVLGGLMLVLSPAFFGWDRGRVDGPRMALYGLYLAGEVLAMGSLCLAFMGTLCGRVEAYAMMICGFGGSFFTVYATRNIYLSNLGNISKNRGDISEK